MGEEGSFDFLPEMSGRDGVKAHFDLERQKMQTALPPGRAVNQKSYKSRSANLQPPGSFILIPLLPHNVHPDA